MFDFIVCMKEKAKKKKDQEQLIARASESEQMLEESAPGKLDTEALVSKRIGQVCRKNVLV